MRISRPDWRRPRRLNEPLRDTREGATLISVVPITWRGRVPGGRRPASWLLHLPEQSTRLGNDVGPPVGLKLDDEVLVSLNPHALVEEMFPSDRDDRSYVAWLKSHFFCSFCASKSERTSTAKPGNRL
jgi:hypothetical protein